MSMFGFFAVVLGPLMRLVYNLLPSFGWTLIVFTVLVRLVSLPLDIKQQKSMAKNAVFQPMINEIQQKYKNNQQKQSEELMRLQQEYGYNPMAGCWPMLLNMVVLFGVIEVVYRPVHYILGIPNDVISAACNELGLTGGVMMQTDLIKAIHGGAAMPAALSAEQFGLIQSFNTDFFGIDMCERAQFPGGSLPVLLIPLAAAVTLFLSTWLMQKISGTEAQMQGPMKYTMLAMNLMFVVYCFSAPVGFSLYYAVSNICMILRSVYTNRVYSPEKFKAQYEAELAAKKAASKSKKTLVVEEGGKKVSKQVSSREMDRVRLERARQLEDAKYAGERTTPLTAEERAAQEAAAKKGRRKKE